MKIAIDLTSLADNFSGIERYALCITQELIKLDKMNKHTFILFFKRKIPQEISELLKRKNVRYKICQGNSKLFFGQFVFPFHLYRVKADAYLFLAFPSPLLFHKKGIYNIIHDLTCWDCPETMKRKMQIFFRLSMWNSLLFSKGIIVISKFTKKRVIEKFHYKKKLTLVYCGISSVFMDYVSEINSNLTDNIKKSEREAAVRKKYHLPEQYLLCLATLEPRKNLAFLVEAYVELQKEGGISIPLVLAGRKGWNMDEFLDKIEDNSRKNIIITGFIDEPDLPLVYHMADCFVFPSLYEGFGMPPLEAITVGTMVISSDAASLPEVLGQAAVYFKLGDKQGLKDRIRQGISDGVNQVTVQEIQKRVEKFQWKNSAVEVAKMLHMSE